MVDATENCPFKKKNYIRILRLCVNLKYDTQFSICKWVAEPELEETAKYYHVESVFKE